MLLPVQRELTPLLQTELYVADTNLSDWKLASSGSSITAQWTHVQAINYLQDCHGIGYECNLIFNILKWHEKQLLSPHLEIQHGQHHPYQKQVWKKNCSIFLSGGLQSIGKDQSVLHGHVSNLPPRLTAISLWVTSLWYIMPWFCLLTMYSRSFCFYRP